MCYDLRHSDRRDTERRLHLVFHYVFISHKTVITIAIRLRYDYDKTTIRRKIDMLIFLLASNFVEWKQARTILRSRIVVVS